MTGYTVKVNNVVSQTVTYTYDNNGNQLTMVTNGALASSNTYDRLNRLVTTATDGTAVVNTYNGEGLRVAKAVNGSLTRYLYEYDKVVLELDGSGNQVARNVYGTNLLTRTAGSDTYYYMYNGHADVTALINTSGQVVGTYYYDAFGNILEHTGTDSNVTYAGYQYDKETGLYYLNSRMYDPKVARFLQEDTYRGTADDPLSLNLYTYCYNEPIMYTDPTGHYSVRDMVPEQALAYYDEYVSPSRPWWQKAGTWMKYSVIKPYGQMVYDGIDIQKKFVQSISRKASSYYSGQMASNIDSLKGTVEGIINTLTLNIDPREYTLPMMLPVLSKNAQEEFADRSKEQLKEFVGWNDVEKTQEHVIAILGGDISDERFYSLGYDEAQARYKMAQAALSATPFMEGVLLPEAALAAESVAVNTSRIVRTSTQSIKWTYRG